MTKTPEIRIAVLGGGIGGLAAAAFLRRAGLLCTVYEQATRLSEVGAGLVVAPNAARLLRRLGVLDELRSRAVVLEVGWEFRRWQDGSVLSAEALSQACEELYGEQTYTAHRADLLEVIRSVVPNESIRLGMRCVRVEPGTPYVLHFANGDTAHADIVIGADGIHSIVREALTEPVPPTPSGLCAYRSLVPADRAPDFARRPAQTLWLGPKHHFVHYPVSAGRYVNLVAFGPTAEHVVESWTATTTTEAFLAEFAGWDERVIDLITAASPPGQWALIDRAPLPHWSAGRATILGDAAHPMFPFFAQGAAQAIEDAAVLAECLAAEPGEPEAALRRYEALRLPRTSRMQEVSHDRALANHLPDGPEQRSRDAELAQSDPLVANGWIYSYDPALEVGDPAGARR